MDLVTPKDVAARFEYVMQTGKAIKVALSLGEDIVAARLLNDLEFEEGRYLFGGTPDTAHKPYNAGKPCLFTAAEKQRCRDAARSIAERGYSVWDEEHIYDEDCPLEWVDHAKMEQNR